MAEAALDVAAAQPDEFSAIAVLADACQSRRTTPARMREVVGERRRLRRRAWMSDVLDDIAEGTCSVLEHGCLTRVERVHLLPRARRQPADLCSTGPHLSRRELRPARAGCGAGRSALPRQRGPTRSRPRPRPGRIGRLVADRPARLGSGVRPPLLDRREDRRPASTRWLGGLAAQVWSAVRDRRPWFEHNMVSMTHRVRRSHLLLGLAGDRPIT